MIKKHTQESECHRFMFLFITTVPIIKMFACGEGDSGEHVLCDTTSRGLCGLVCPSRTSERLCMSSSVNGALDAAVKEKLDNYQHDHNKRHFFFLKISGDFLRLLYILSHRQAANYFTRKS